MRKIAMKSIYRNDVGHVSLGTRHHVVAWADSKLESPLSVFRVVDLVWMVEHSCVEGVEPEISGYSSRLGL